MGKPLPLTASPAGTGAPPSGDQANAVVSGQFTAQGQVSAAFCFYGAFNIAMYGIVANALTTFAGASSVSFASQANLTPGQSIISTLVPPGTVIATVSIGGMVGTSQIGGLTAAQIAAIPAGVDPNATVVGGLAGLSLTVALQKSYDGGSTWIVCGIGGGGTPATYQFGGVGGLTDSVSFVVAEPEKGCAYRLLVTSYTSGTLGFRLSATGLAAMTWGIPVG